MKKTNKIVKEAAVLLFTAMLLTSISAVVADTNETTVNVQKSTHVFGPSALAEVELNYYQDPALLRNVIGLTAPGIWQSAIRLTQDEMSPYAGWEMTKVVVYLSTDNGQSEVYANLIIYGEGTPTAPGDIIYQEDDLYFDMTDGYIIELDTIIALDDHEEIWIAMQWDQTVEEGFIPFADDGPAVMGKGGWVGTGGSWSQLADYDLDYNWGMGAIIEGEFSFTELVIDNVKGPVGVSADVSNAGTIAAENVQVSMTVTGGLLGMVNKNISVDVGDLAVDGIETVASGPVIGIGPIDIVISASADNAADVIIERSGFLLGILVIGL
jgi:hypothetical protein